MNAPAQHPPASRPSVYARIAAACHDRRRMVVIAWVAVIVLVGALSGLLGNSFRDQFDLPDSDSKTGVDILRPRLRRRGHRCHRHDRVPGRAGGRRPGGASRR